MVKKKVCIDAKPLIKNKTGIGWYAYKTVEEMLKTEQIDTRFIGCAHDLLGRDSAKHDLWSMGFKEVHTQKLIPGRLYKLFWNIIKIRYNWLFSGGDIYHFYNFVVPPISKKKKVVVVVYDMVYKKFPETMKASNLYLLNRDMGRSVKRADHIITISQSAKNDILAYFDINERNISVMPPGIDYSVYSAAQAVSEEKRNQIRRKYRLPEKFFLYLGTIEPRKNVGTIFRAYSTLPRSIRDEYKIIIAGGMGWKADEIMKLPKQLNIENDLMFAGYVDEEDKPFIYSLAEVFLFPSLYEGFGLPVAEALASGTPVITANNSSLPEAGGDGASYVDCMDDAGIAQEIVKYIEDNDYRSLKLAAGQKHVKTLSWEDNARRTFEIYQRLRDKRC